MKKTTALLLLLCAAILQPIALQAKPDEDSKGKFREKVRERMKEIDSDRDGNISYVEAESADAKRLLENFDAIDSDGNGTLTREEMRAYHQQKSGNKMKKRKQSQES
ncbi:MAG: hypothetical protein ACPGGJ_04615 [Coraliomargarita sp.]